MPCIEGNFENNVTPRSLLNDIFLKLIQLDYDELSLESKKALANKLVKACIREDVRAELDSDWSGLIRSLLNNIDKRDSGNYVGASLDLLDTLERVLEAVLLSFDESSYESSSEQVKSSVDALVRFSNRVADYKIPFKAASARNDETIRLLKEELKKTAGDLSNDVDKKIIESVSELKSSMAIDHIAVLGVFSAIALAFMGGTSWGLEAISASAQSAGFGSTILLTIIVFFGLFNTLAMLMYFIAVIVGRRDTLVSQGKIIWSIVNALMILLVLCILLYWGRA